MNVQLPKKYWSLKTCAAQLESCEFECEGGPIANNDAFIWLKGASAIGPEFLPGQGVFFEVTSEQADVKLAAWSPFYIVGCHMMSDSERRYWIYDLSNDPPAPWHYGTVQFRGIGGDRLRLAPPPQGEKP